MKRKHYTRILTTILFLLTMTLPILLTSCRSNTVESHVDFPDGWEVVSQEGDATQLRVKAGSDAYHWMDCATPFPHADGYYFLDLEFVDAPNSDAVKPNENGNITVIIYYGYSNVRFNHTLSRYSHLPDSDQEEMQLRIIRQWDLDKVLIQLDGLTAGNTVLIEPHSDAQDICRVGFTRAVLAEIPLSDFTNGWETTEFCITKNSGNGYAIEEELRITTCKFNDILFFSSSSLSLYLNSFPYTLLNKYSYIVNATLFLSALILMIVSAIKKKSHFIHFIPCVLGIVYTGIRITYLNALPAPDRMFGGFESLGVTLQMYLMALAYAVLGILLLIIRLIINHIRRKRHPNAPSDPTSSVLQ